MNPWDKDYPWLNTGPYAKVPYSTKLFIYNNLKNKTVDEQRVQSYNWGDTFQGISDFVEYLKVAFGITIPQREVDFQTTVEQTSLRDLFQIEKQVTDALKTRRPLTIANVNYSLSDLQKFVKPTIDNVQKNLVQVAVDKYETDALTKKVDKEKLQQMKIAANQSVIDAQYTFDSIKDVFESNPEPRYEQLYRKAAIDLQTKQETLARLTAAPQYRVGAAKVVPKPEPVTVAPGVTVQAGRTVTPTTTTTPTAQPTPLSSAEMQKMYSEAYAGRVPTPSGKGGGAKQPAAGGVTKAAVDAALAASGLPDTPANRKSIREDLKAGKKPIGDWLTVFKKEFPQYTYLLDETVFGADVTALLQRAVTEKWYDSDQLETLMTQNFAGTQYAKNTTTAQQNFDKLTPANKQAQIDQFKLVVQQTFGNLQFDDATLTNIATKAARDNRQGKALELYVYQQSFAKPVGTAEFAQPTAATRALTSSAADEIRQIGRDYGSRVTDQEVQDVLTGKTTIDSLRQTYKMAAKRWYKGAADDIDAGVTVEQLFRPYKQYAAAILGKPLEQIDLIDANGAPTLYAQALEGKDGPMSISEWTQKLRSDDRFGWQFTDEAKQKATGLVMSLEKAFGFRA